MIFAIAIFVGTFVYGQQMSGVVLSNYAGINSVRLNPSNLINSKLYFDINLSTADIFFENNFLYIHKEDFKLLNFLKRNPDLPSYDSAGQGLDYSSGINFIQGFEQTDVLGPSFSIVLGDHAAGISTRVVTMTSINDLPEYLGKLMFEGLVDTTLHGLPQNHGHFDAAVAGWWEIGLSYAWDFKKDRFRKWSLGINARRLWGYAGAYLVNNNAEYTVMNDTLINIRNLNADMGFSVPLDYNNNDFPDPGKTFKGRGMVYDFGVTYTKRRNVLSNQHYKNFCRYEYEEYLYKIGLSLIDIGSLKFKENTQQHSFDNVAVNWERIDTLEYRNINDLTGLLSEVLYKDSTASLRADNIRLGMPAAISFQADYNYFSNWHLSSLVVLPLKLHHAQLQRPGQALLNLRYETNIFEVALPISLYDFKKTRIGLSARYYYFTIGTDKLGGFFGFDDFYGMDFYLSVKFHILKGWCGRYKPTPDCRNLGF